MSMCSQVLKVDFSALTFLVLLTISSTSSSTSLKGHRDLTLNNVKRHLFGITSMQVILVSSSIFLSRKFSHVVFVFRFFRFILPSACQLSFLYLTYNFHLWGSSMSFQMLNLEDCKLETCCSIFGLAQYQMHLLMLYKDSAPLRSEQLVLQR